MSETTAVALPAIEQALQREGIDRNQVNLVSPTETYGHELSKYEKLSVEVVVLNPDPKNGVDVYLLPGGVLGFSKVALMKIAGALGISFDPRLSGIVERDRTISRARATGAMRKPNGEVVIHSDEKTIDVEVYEEELRSSPKPKSEADIKREVLTRRKFKDELANSGAKLRVIRQLVALPGAVRPEVLRKPFVFPKVIADMDAMAENPKMAEIVKDRMGDTASAVFGKPEAEGEIKQPLALPDSEVTDFDDDIPGGEETGSALPPPEPAKQQEAMALTDEQKIEIIKEYLQANNDHPALAVNQKSWMEQTVQSKEVHDLPWWQRIFAEVKVLLEAGAADA